MWFLAPTFKLQVLNYNVIITIVVDDATDEGTTHN